MKKTGFVLLIWGVLAFGCDPCKDCGEPLAYEPTVAVKFINQDSLDALTDTISNTVALINYNDSLVEGINDDLIDIQDSIDVLNDSIEAGKDEYLDELEAAKERQQELIMELKPFEKLLDELDSMRKSYNSIKTTINSGLLLVDQVTILSNGAQINYEDSNTVFNLPLLISDMGAGQTDYEIFIKDKSFRFSLTYNLEESLNNARIFRVIATDIEALENYTCDTLIFSCKNDICKSNETTITAIY